MKIDITNLDEPQIEEFAVDDRTSLFVEYSAIGIVSMVQIAAPGFHPGSLHYPRIELGTARRVLEILIPDLLHLVENHNQESPEPPKGLFRETYSSSELSIHFDFLSSYPGEILVYVLVDLTRAGFSIQRDRLAPWRGEILSRRFFDTSGLMLVMSGGTWDINSVSVYPRQSLDARFDIPQPIDLVQADDLILRLFGPDIAEKKYHGRFEVGGYASKRYCTTESLILHECSSSTTNCVRVIGRSAFEPVRMPPAREQ